LHLKYKRTGRKTKKALKFSRSLKNLSVLSLYKNLINL